MQLHRICCAAGLAAIILTGCQAERHVATATHDASRYDGRERMEMGPPPFGHWRIVGGAVPDWTPANMRGEQMGPLSALTWESVGPRPITGEYWSGNDDAAGRVVAIAPHPVDPDTCYIGAASGGVWKTTDGGTTWTPLTDELSTTNTGALGIDPNNPDTIYLGTGEYQTGSAGDGVFRSTDGGQSWVRLTSAGNVGYRHSRIVVDPTDSNVVHLAGNYGYFRSDNAGANWTRYLFGSCSSLDLDPQNPSILFVAKHNDGVYRSLDGGDTLTKLTNGLPSTDISRVLVDVADSNREVVYAAFANNNSGLRGLYKSTDGGDSWSQLLNTPDFPYPQSWYDMYVGVDPSDEDLVYCGGVSPYYANAGIIRSTDGGVTWSEISLGLNNVQTHPDHHTIVWGPTGIIWEGNDGGVWKSFDGGDTWINCNNDLAITQLYTIGLSVHDDALVLGGTQDEGSIERVTEALPWPQVIGGDGGYLAYDHENPTIKYTTYVYLSVQRWINGVFRNISGPWSNDPRNWIAPLVMDPNDSSTLVAGTNRVWRTHNADGAANWSTISTTQVSGGGTINCIAIAVGNSDLIYSGSNIGKVWVTTDAANWVERSNGLPSGGLSDILLNPDDPGEAYASFANSVGKRVMHTVDMGLNWTNVTGDLPNNVQAKALAVDWRFNPRHLYIGTGAGVWSSDDGGATWGKDGTDLPNVNVGDLQIDEDSGFIFVGTYGRGAWRAPLPDAAIAVLPDAFNVIFGAYQSGGVADLHASDDSYLHIQQRPSVSLLLPVIRVEVSGAGPTSAVQLSFTLEASASALPENVPQRIELFDFDAATWELVDDRIATRNDSVVTVVIDSNAGRFVDTDGSVRARLNWFDPGNVAFPNWGAAIDEATWLIQP